MVLLFPTMFTDQCSPGKKYFIQAMQSSEQVMPVQVNGHSDRPIVLPGHLLHKLLVVQLLPEQEIIVGFETVCDAAPV